MCCRAALPCTGRVELLTRVQRLVCDAWVCCVGCRWCVGLGGCGVCVQCYMFDCLRVRLWPTVCARSVGGWRVVTRVGL